MQTDNNRFPIAGVLPSPEDQRDIPYVSPFTPEELPPFLDLRHLVYEIENQGPIGSCVANAVCSQCEAMYVLNGRKPEDLSRMFLYNATKAYEGRLGEEGLYTRDAYKVAYKSGICLENGNDNEPGYPYDLSLDNVQPPQKFYDLASQRRLERYEAVIRPNSLNKYYDHEERIHLIKSALNERILPAVAFSVTDSIFNLTGNWRDHDYRGSKFAQSGQVKIVGGHLGFICGYDDEAGKWIYASSWGREWADNGFGGLPFNIISEPFFESWAARRFAGQHIPLIPGIKFEGVNDFRMEARIVPTPEEIGKPFNIWMGAIDSQGNKYLRAPITHAQVNPVANDLSGSADVWRRFNEDYFIPTVEDYILTEDTKIKVVQWRDLRGFKGATFFLGYGRSPFDMKIQKLCTL